jgi:hypothetical protein
MVDDPKNTFLIRYHAIDALRQIADNRVREVKAAVPCLVAALKGSDFKLRPPAAYALGRIGPDGRVAIPVLTRYLKDGSGRDPIVAAQTLYRLDPKNELVVPTLIKGLKDKGHFCGAAQLAQEVRPKNREVAGFGIAEPAHALVTPLRGGLERSGAIFLRHGVSLRVREPIRPLRQAQEYLH